MIREATEHDVNAMSFVVATTWKQVYKGVFSHRFLHQLSLEQWAEPFKRGIQAKKNTFLVYEDAGRVVGVVVAGENHEVKGEGKIYSLYVLPEYQGKSIGKQLLQGVLDRLPFSCVKLTVVTQNVSAQRFYLANGFVNTQQEIESEVAGGKFTGYVFEWHRE